MTLGSADTYRPAIHGDVTLGASDSFDQPGRGDRRDHASSGDLLEFSGNFGAATIDNFAAGTGATHDTIEFGASGFG